MCHIYVFHTYCRHIYEDHLGLNLMQQPPCHIRPHCLNSRLGNTDLCTCPGGLKIVDVDSDFFCNGGCPHYGFWCDDLAIQREAVYPHQDTAVVESGKLLEIEAKALDVVRGLDRQSQFFNINCKADTRYPLGSEDMKWLLELYEHLGRASMSRFRRIKGGEKVRFGLYAHLMPPGTKSGRRDEGHNDESLNDVVNQLREMRSHLRDKVERLQANAFERIWLLKKVQLPLLKSIPLKELDEDKRDCLICLEKMIDETEAEPEGSHCTTPVELPCHHAFGNCVENWLSEEGQLSCPCCRAKFNEDEWSLPWTVDYEGSEIRHMNTERLYRPKWLVTLRRELAHLLP